MGSFLAPAFSTDNRHINGRESRSSFSLLLFSFLFVTVSIRITAAVNSPVGFLSRWKLGMGFCVVRALRFHLGAVTQPPGGRCRPFLLSSGSPRINVAAAIRRRRRRNFYQSISIALARRGKYINQFTELSEHVDPCGSRKRKKWREGAPSKSYPSNAKWVNSSRLPSWPIWQIAMLTTAK